MIGIKAMLQTQHEAGNKKTEKSKHHFPSIHIQLLIANSNQLLIAAGKW